jgi:hypothetical protein
MTAFHANGSYDLAEIIRSDRKVQERQTAEKRMRFEMLLCERVVEFRNSGFWGKQAILKSIRAQVEKEYSLQYSLF